MDWQHSYWLLESAHHECPEIFPLISFKSYEEEEAFCIYDFEQLVTAILWHRRTVLWIKHDEHNVYDDTVWPFLRKVTPVSSCKTPNMELFCFSHASQKPVEFYLNTTLIPTTAVLKPTENWTIVLKPTENWKTG
jgi:hypothetical protein